MKNATKNDGFPKQHRDEMRIGRMKITTIGPNRNNAALRSKFAKFTVWEMARAIAARGWDVDVKLIDSATCARRAGKLKKTGGAT